MMKEIRILLKNQGELFLWTYLAKSSFQLQKEIHLRKKKVIQMLHKPCLNNILLKAILMA